MRMVKMKKSEQSVKKKMGAHNFSKYSYIPAAYPLKRHRDENTHSKKSTSGGRRGGGTTGCGCGAALRHGCGSQAPCSSARLRVRVVVYRLVGQSSEEAYNRIKNNVKKKTRKRQKKHQKKPKKTKKTKKKNTANKPTHHHHTTHACDGPGGCA